NVFLFVLIACAIQNIAVMFLSVFKGVQRMDKSNGVEITMSLVNIGGTVFFLQRGWGIYGLAVNAVVMSLIATALACWTVRRSMPKLRLGWHFNRSLFGEMFAYGAKIQVSRFGNLIFFQVD